MQTKNSMHWRVVKLTSTYRFTRSTILALRKRAITSVMRNPIKLNMKFVRTDWKPYHRLRKEPDINHEEIVCHEHGGRTMAIIGCFSHNKPSSHWLTIGCLQWSWTEQFYNLIVINQILARSIRCSKANCSLLSSLVEHKN